MCNNFIYKTMEKELRCVAGCKALTGGELYHHKDCPFYPESLSKMYDDLKNALTEPVGDEEIGEIVNELAYKQHCKEQADDFLEKVWKMKEWLRTRLPPQLTEAKVVVSEMRDENMRQFIIDGFEFNSGIRAEHYWAAEMGAKLYRDTFKQSLTQSKTVDSGMVEFGVTVCQMWERHLFDNTIEHCGRMDEQEKIVKQALKEAKERNE